jgi:hypothetical protein
MGSILPSVLGFVGGILAWFGVNYWGRSLLRFWDLRLEAHETMYLYANVYANRPADLARAQEGSAHLRKLGAKIDGLRAVLPPPLPWYLRVRGYDLHSAAEGLTGLSNSLGVNDGDMVRFRVQAQKTCACQSIRRSKREQNVIKDSPTLNYNDRRVRPRSPNAGVRNCLVFLKSSEQCDKRPT